MKPKTLLRVWYSDAFHWLEAVKLYTFALKNAIFLGLLYNYCETIYKILNNTELFNSTGMTRILKDFFFLRELFLVFYHKSILVPFFFIALICLLANITQIMRKYQKYSLPECNKTKKYFNFSKLNLYHRMPFRATHISVLLVSSCPDFYFHSLNLFILYLLYQWIPKSDQPREGETSFPLKIYFSICKSEMSAEYIEILVKQT